jgi:hypothetical protein
MSKIGLIQPGRLGDIIICLPIAKHYYDLGYKVIWPVFAKYYNDVQSVASYAEFIPVTDDVYHCIAEARGILTHYDDITVFDIAATFPGSECTEEYVALGDGFGDEAFDQFKYRKCGVPFEKKWDLNIRRNIHEEERVYSEYVKSAKYNVAGLTHSRGSAAIKIESDNPTVHINENHNFFLWIKVLENANNIVLVDSAMSNLVEQLNLANRKTLFTKPRQPLPVYKNNWNIRTI